MRTNTPRQAATLADEYIYIINKSLYIYIYESNLTYVYIIIKLSYIYVYEKGQDQAQTGKH